jgi:hypothetical protein
MMVALAFLILVSANFFLSKQIGQANAHRIHPRSILDEIGHSGLTGDLLRRELGVTIVSTDYPVRVKPIFHAYTKCRPRADSGCRQQKAANDGIVAK